MSKKDNNINNVDEADVNINDTDVTSDTDKDADTVEAQGSSDADVKAEKSDNASDAQGAEETVDINNKKDQKDAVIEDLQDRLKRQMAEFDNYRKRTDKEKSAMFEMGASDVVKKLLPIVDNFERGFKSVTEEELQTPLPKVWIWFTSRQLRCLKTYRLSQSRQLVQSLILNFIMQLCTWKMTLRARILSLKSSRRVTHIEMWLSATVW